MSNLSNTNSKTLIPQQWYTCLVVKPEKSKKQYIYYTLYFASIITPYKITHIRLIFQNSLNSFNSRFKKLFVKQSYLILTWFWYIKTNHNSKNLITPSFVFKPTKQYRITFLKTPMANKTFSQEQVKLQFFALTISFKINLNFFSFTKNFFKLNHILTLILKLRQTIPFVETNFFLLKRFRLSINFKENFFFKII